MALIVADRFRLLRVLDLRAGIRIAGRTPRPLYYHTLFTRLETTRIVVPLICSGVGFLTLAQK